MPPRSRPARRPFAVLAAVLAVTAGCTSTVSGSPASAPPPISGFPSPAASPAPSTSDGSAFPQPQFEQCSQFLHIPGLTIPAALQGKLSAECASVPVPLDYAHPAAGRVNVTALRIHDSDNPGDTPLLIDPGGPGGSGVQFAVGVLTEISPTVLQHYDLVGFDPRGVGLSSPITCLTAAQKDAFVAASPDVTTPNGFRAARALARQFARACENSVGESLPYFNTVNAARDMEAIRLALHASSMNYLGFSYGTELGSVYAHFYPDKVNIEVLDGAIDPLADGIQSSTAQLRGFEASFDQFAASCRTGSGCQSLADPRRTAEDIEAETVAQPLPTTTGRKLTASLAATGILEGLYTATRWARLGAALVAAKGGDGSGLLALADSYNQRLSTGQYANIIDSGQTVLCNDQEPGPSDPVIRTTADDWARNYPIFGKWFAISLFACQQWQPHRTVPPKPTAATSTKVLIVGNLHDPATPYIGAEHLAETMGNAEVLSWNGTGHTSYLSGSSCIDNYVNRYLIDKTLPPEHITCPR